MTTYKVMTTIKAASLKDEAPEKRIRAARANGYSVAQLGPGSSQPTTQEELLETWLLLEVQHPSSLCVPAPPHQYPQCSFCFVSHASSALCPKKQQSFGAVRAATHAVSRVCCPCRGALKKDACVCGFGRLHGFGTCTLLLCGGMFDGAVRP
jgi:hypothetical protein